jgi:hypothetical protein
MVYVLYYNAQVNLIVIFIHMHVLLCILYFVNCPTIICLPSMLYLYGETPLMNYGCWSILLHIYYHLLQALFTFRKHYFTLPQTNIYFHTIRLILCYQQTSEIGNLTASWGKVDWLCCVQVPRCCWH